MSDHEHVVVAGALQRPTRLVDIVGLDPELFSDRLTRALFVYQVGYFRKRGRKNALDLALARSRLEQSEAEIASDLLGLVIEYEGYDPVTDPEWRDALASLVTTRQRELIREHGTAALEAVLSEDWAQAKQQMRAGLMAADDVSVEDDRPVNLRSAVQVQRERERVRALDGKESERPESFDVGFKRIMRAVSLRRQELTFIGGYASDGKTAFSKTIAYNANVLSGARVLFVALEMTREEMQVLFVAQHAATLDPRGVDYRAILDGEASKQDRALYDRALADFEVDETADVTELRGLPGALHVWAPKRKPTMDQFCDRVRAIQQDEGLDLVVGDFFELIEPSKDLKQYRLNLKYMAEQAKELARDEEVWVIMNHQISRGGRDAAEKRHPPHYLMRDLGESSGIERSADHILWVFNNEDLKDECEARIGIAKARKGKTIVEGYHVMADFSKALMAEIDDEG